MPIATPKQYAAMLDAAQQGDYAYPAVNITSITTINAALKAFADSKSDGIIQMSTGGGQFASGLSQNDAVLGCIDDILIGLHTDHCQPEKAAGFLKPLIEATAKRRADGQGNLFQSHMLDASILPLEENMAISKEYLELCAANEIILEVEAGVVGGEEDGSAGTEDMPAEKLYTTPEDMLTVYESLNGIGRYMFAATFGNVHGAYKPGAVKLRPDILKQGQDAVTGKHGEAAKFDLVFHGGSGSEIKETLEYGVIKMNIDTDTQYAFTRPIADHMLANYAGVLKIDGEVGIKKVYDPRSYLKKAEQATADRLIEACNDLESTGKTIFGTV